ncbi:unnamed protein product [Mortierella alpina]
MEPPRLSTQPPQTAWRSRHSPRSPSLLQRSCCTEAPVRTPTRKCSCSTPPVTPTTARPRLCHCIPVSHSPIPPSRILQEAAHPSSALATPWPRQLPAEPHPRQQRWDLDWPEDAKRLGHSTRPFPLASPKDESSTGPIDPWARNYPLQSQITLPATTFGSSSFHHLARPVVFDRGSYPHHDFYPPATDASGQKANNTPGVSSTRTSLDNHEKFGPSHPLSLAGSEGRLEHSLVNRDGLPMPRPRSERAVEASYYGDVIEEMEDDRRMSTHQGFTPSHSYLHSYARSRPQRELLHQLDQPPQQQLQLDATPHRHAGSHAYSTAAPPEGYIAHNQRHNLDHGSLDRNSVREGSARTLSDHPGASSSLPYHSQHPSSQNIQHQSHQQQTDLTSADRRGPQQLQARIETFSGEQKEDQFSAHAFDADAQQHPSVQNVQRNSHATQPYTIPAFNSHQHATAQPYRSSHPQQTSQNLAYSSPTPSCTAHSPKYVPPSPEYRPVSPPTSFKQSDSDGSQHTRDAKPWSTQSGGAQHASQPSSQHSSQQPSQPPLQQKGNKEHVQSVDHDSDDQDGSSRRKNSSRSKDVRFKFGTDMPKTVDLKAAIESCDLLCKFALHYASQETKDSRLDTSMVSLEDARDRAMLQTIRTLNSTILIGSQHSGRNEDTAKRRRSSLRQPMAIAMSDESRPVRSNDVNTDGGTDQRMDDDDDDDDEDDAEDEDDDDDDDYTQFGHGPPSHEMVHELAKAATSIFQLAIRIKAWVGMTPEERVLDEDINTIRGKRCLFMDGSSMMRMSTLDPHSQQGKEWAMIQAKASSSQGTFKTPGALERYPQGFKRQNEVDVEMRSADRWDYSGQSTPAGSYASNAPSFSPMDSSAGDMMFDRAKLNSDGSGKTLGSSENNGSHADAPTQKYRKRAKRTQPPGRCLSCDSSDTPEWRRGPDGARTLCNACGLHYAKLLKRQNQQQAKQLQEQQAKQRVLQSGGGDDPKVNKLMNGLDGMDSDAKKPAGTQLQTIKFQFPRRPVRTPLLDGATPELIDKD